MTMFKKIASTLLIAVSVLLLVPMEAAAHGERAQQGSMRTRSVHWFDLEIQPRQVAVNEVLTITGKFMPSEWWPEHIASIEDASFLNIGVPGPVFVRVDSRVNGVPMIRSTHFELGRVYEYEIKLKGRTPGRYHAHPVISVEGAGPVIGPALWVEVTGDQADFEHTITTLTGETLDTETMAMGTIIGWNLLWFVIGIAWVGWWFRKLPVIMPRYIRVQQLGVDANRLITIPDMIVSFLFLTGTLLVIVIGFLWTQSNYPITTPLQTGKVEVEPLPEPPPAVEIAIDDATYRIPGRSFQMEVTITNNTDSALRIGEFMTANIRFINPKVLDVQPQDEDDLVAPNGLIVDAAPIEPGETRTISVFAEDALWETYRLTSLIYEPDSRFAGLLFLYDEEGNRYFQEIGAPMIPTFV